MDEQIQHQLRQIKQSFRLMMNGPASQSMRDKGVDYKLNWGVPLPSLKAMAQEYGKNRHLAIELWKEDIRECKILATLIMPADEMPEDLAELWMEQTPLQEMAEMLAFNLLQHVSYAPDMAYRWIASGKELYEICGYNILSRIFLRGEEPNERGINEFIDQAQAALQSESVGVRHAAKNCLVRFSEINDVTRGIVEKAIGKDLI